MKLRILDYSDLVVYQRLVELHLEIHNISLRFPKFETYELGSQIRRSSNAIPANLAEGWNNKHLKMYLEGINRALGELRETKHHLMIAFRKGYVVETTYFNLKNRYEECGKMLRGLEKSLLNYPTTYHLPPKS